MTTEVPESTLDEIGNELSGADTPSENVAVMVRRYVALHQQKQEAEAVVRGISAQKSQLEEQLAERFGLEGLQNVKADGFCVSRKKETYVSLVPETKQQAMELLRSMGLGDMLTVNSNTLRARVKEWIEQGNMPPEFEPLIKQTESYGLQVRKG